MAYAHFERLSALDLSFLAMEDGRSRMHIGSGHTALPPPGDARPPAAASVTAGCSNSTSSTPRGHTFSPPGTITQAPRSR